MRESIICVWVGGGVVGVKVCVIDKLIVSDNMREFLYNHYIVF